MRLTSVVWKVKEAAKPPRKLFILPKDSGGYPYREDSVKVIRFVLRGCANRPFFHIAVQEATEEQHGQVIEQVGTYDPLPNKNNEKLVALNFARIQHWINQGAIMSIPVKKILGLAGYTPIHPATLALAWNQRKLLMKELAKLEAAAAAAGAAKQSAPGDSGSDNVESSKSPNTET